MLQLLEEGCVSVLRGDVECGSRQRRIDGGGVAKVTLCDLPGIRNDLRISADIAQQSVERCAQQAFIRRLSGGRRTEARESRSKVLSHPRRNLRVLLRRRGHLLIDAS